jgi:hypothetical protein
MRLARALLLSALTISTGSVALANEAAPAQPQAEASTSRVPLRIVRMLPKTHQVLLHDRIRGTHVVAEVGQDIHGYIVEDISGDEVTLVAENGAEVILTAPADPAWRRRVAERRTAAGTPAAVAPTGEPAPVDPYADMGSATSASHAQIEPGEGGVRVASATSPSHASSAALPPPATPADPYPMDPAIAAFVEAAGSPAPTATPSSSTDGAASQAPARADLQAPAAAPAKADDPATALAMAATGSSLAPTTSGRVPTVPAPTSAVPTTGAPAAGAVHGASSPAASAAPVAAGLSTFIVARRDIETALSDFGATAATFDATFVANGLRIDSLHAGTILAQLGLRAGDVITSVDGMPLRSFDDAANLYARATSVRLATIAVLRGGAPTIFRVEIR